MRRRHEKSRRPRASPSPTVTAGTKSSKTVNKFVILCMLVTDLIHYFSFVHFFVGAVISAVLLVVGQPVASGKLEALEQSKPVGQVWQAADPD